MSDYHLLLFKNTYVFASCFFLFFISFFFLLLEMGSCIPDQPQTGCVVKDDLELVTFVLLSPECWDSRLALPPTVYAVPGIEPRASGTSGKHSAHPLH